MVSWIRVPLRSIVIHPLGFVCNLASLLCGGGRAGTLFIKVWVAVPGFRKRFVNYDINSIRKLKTHAVLSCLMEYSKNEGLWLWKTDSRYLMG